EDLFGSVASAVETPGGIEFETEREWALRERLARERETLGFYQSGHPVDAYADIVDQICSGRLPELAQQVRAGAVPTAAGKTGWQPRTKVLFAAWVKDLRFFRGDPRAEGRNARASYRITVEDGDEEVSCWMDAEPFARVQGVVKPDSLVFVLGELGV